MLRAVDYVSRCRGGSQSHILRASDDRLYITKFQDNPQGSKILAHEWIACRLAQVLGFSVPYIELLAVDNAFVERTPELGARSVTGNWNYKPGTHFASEWITGAEDYLSPDSHLLNVDEYAGMFAFDRWTGQADVRQAIFTHHADGYFATFVDFGYAFMAETWPEGGYYSSCLHGLCPSRWVYKSIVGWHDFEPWLSGIERLSADTFFRVIEDIPSEWMPRNDTERIASSLLFRQDQLRSYLLPTLSSSFAFPSWQDHVRDAA